MSPTTRYRGYGVAMLMALVHMLAVGDRFLLSILIEPIKADLTVRDGTIGMLQGPAFAVLNGLAIVPMILIARRWPLARLLALAMLGSSVATIACGLARSGEALAAARMAMGLAQAAIGPAALGLIVAAMTPAHGGRGIGLFTGGAALGRGVAMMLERVMWYRATADVQRPSSQFFLMPTSRLAPRSGSMAAPVLVTPACGTSVRS